MRLRKLLRLWKDKKFVDEKYSVILLNQEKIKGMVAVEGVVVEEVVEEAEVEVVEAKLVSALM